MSGELVTALVKLDRDEVDRLVKQKLQKGDDPLLVLAECREGMTLVGERFQRGDYYLAELLLSAEIFKAAVGILNPALAKSRPPDPLGTVVLATLKGDIHDLGKNILATLLESHGFAVHDLGVDVSPSFVVQRVKEIEPEFVGFSALITTAFDSMRECAGMLEKAGLRNQVKLMIGGGVTTPLTRDYVGADFQTTDAMEGVMYCMKAARER